MCTGRRGREWGARWALSLSCPMASVCSRHPWVGKARGVHGVLESPEERDVRVLCGGRALRGEGSSGCSW